MQNIQEVFMYLNISEKNAVSTKNIIGIFDMDLTTISKKTRDFLNSEQKKGRILENLNELPRSFILAEEGVYLSPINTVTLKRRLEEK